MAQAHFPRFPFHLSRKWLESHSRMAAGLKTFGIAMAAATLAAMAAVLVARLEWTLNVPPEVAAAADITAGGVFPPMDIPRHRPEQVYERAKTVKRESQQARF